MGELLLELSNFGVNDNLAVALFGVFVEVVLVVILRRPEFIEWFDLGLDWF